MWRHILLVLMSLALGKAIHRASEVHSGEPTLPEHAPFRKIAVFSGGGVRAAFGTALAYELLEDSVRFDEYHALSGGTWGLTLSNLDGGYHSMCDNIMDALETKISGKSQASHKEIGPAMKIKLSSNKKLRLATNSENLQQWTDGVELFLFGREGCGNNAAIHKTWAKGEDQFASAGRLDGRKVYFHVAQVSKKRVVNDCWWTNTDIEDEGPFGCVVDPADMINTTGKVWDYTPISSFSAPDDSTTALEASVISSAAWSSPRVSNFYPPYEMTQPDTDKKLHMTFSDGGVFVNTPVAKPLQDYARCGQKTSMYVFDYSFPDKGSYSMKEILRGAPEKGVTDRGIEGLATRLGLELVSASKSVTPTSKTKSRSKSKSKKSKNSSSDSFWSKVDRNVCTQDLVFRAPASADIRTDGCHDGVQGDLHMHIYGVCGTDSDPIVARKFIKQFPTLDLSFKGIFRTGLAKRWTSSQLEKFSSTYPTFLAKELQTDLLEDTERYGKSFLRDDENAPTEGDKWESWFNHKWESKRNVDFRCSFEKKLNEKKRKPTKIQHQ